MFICFVLWEKIFQKHYIKTNFGILWIESQHDSTTIRIYWFVISFLQVEALLYWNDRNLFEICLLFFWNNKIKAIGLSGKKCSLIFDIPVLLNYQ